MRRKFSPYDIATLAVLASIAFTHAAFVLENPYTAFIETDPSTHYFSSTLEILENGRAFYSDHPGSAYYTYLAIWLAPLKVYTAVTGGDFIEFVYLNIEAVLFLCQAATFMAASAGLWLAASAVNKLTKTWWGGLIFVLTFFTVSLEGLRRMTLVTPEGFMIAVTGVALYFFTKHAMESGDLKSLYLGAFTVGVGVGTKLSILPTTFFAALYFIYVFFSKRRNRGQSFKEALAYAGALCAGFIASTAVLGSRLKEYFLRMYRYASEGGVHGKGISVEEYVQVTKRVIEANQWLIFLGAALIAYVVYRRATKKSVAVSEWLALMGFVSFAAYLPIETRSHFTIYLVSAYVVAAFSVAIVAAKVLKPDRVRYLRVVAVAFLAFTAYQTHTHSVSKNMEQVMRNADIDLLFRDNGVDTNVDVIVLNYDAWTRENYFIMGNGYSFGIYDEVIKKHQPNYLFFVTWTPESHQIVDGLRNDGWEWDYAVMSERFVGRFMKYHSCEVVDEKGRYILLKSR